jgi:hypothetical protein
MPPIDMAVLDAAAAVVATVAVPIDMDMVLEPISILTLGESAVDE